MGTKEQSYRIIVNIQNYNIFYICPSDKYMGMAKFCQEMHYMLSASANYFDFLVLPSSSSSSYSLLLLLLLHNTSSGFLFFYFKADDLVMLMLLLQIIPTSEKRGCSIAFGS